MTDYRMHLQEIYDRFGRLTPELVLDTARDRDNPLHGYIFDRSPGQAAEAWYRQRASELIRRYRVTFRIDEAAEPISIRAWQSVPAADGRRVYLASDEIARDPALSALALQEAERDWKALFRKYGHLKQFIEMVQATLAEEASEDLAA